MKFSVLIAAAMIVMVPGGAQAAPTVTFNGTCINGGSLTQAACSPSVNGTYGNNVQLNAIDDATLQVKLTAWQTKQAGGSISSAFLGSYGGGFGVTGLQDNNGGDNLHQIDNVNGYSDFLMLQFSRAVHLETAGMNVYQMGGVSGMDSDASSYNVSFVTPSVWNASINLNGGDSVSSYWSNTAVGTGASGSRALNASAGFSQVWLIGASMLTTDRNDGFKLSSIIVTPQVIATPEPATWAMMIIGFGGIGATLRRRRSAGAPQAA